MANDAPENQRPIPDYLKLIPLSTPPTSYEYAVEIGTPVTMTSPEIPASAGKFVFEEFRLKESLVIRSENLQRHLEREGVLNFNLQFVAEKEVIRFSFASVHDANIARMYFMDENVYTLGLSHDNPDAPLEEVERIMSDMQREFNESGLAKNVRLELDTENKKIIAIASNKRAFVDLIGDEYHIAPATL